MRVQQALTCHANQAALNWQRTAIARQMSFYAPAQLIADARRHGVTVPPVDVSFSERDCTLEASGRRPRESSLQGTSRLGESCNIRPAIRMGVRMINGLSGEIADSIVQARQLRGFESHEEFQMRVRLESGVIHVAADHLQDLSQAIAGGRYRSRDVPS